MAPFSLLKSIGITTLHFLKRRWLLIVVLVLILAGIGFFLYRRSEAAKPNYTFTRPEYRDLTKTLQVAGIIDAKQQASLRFAAGGKVTYLKAKEGDTVKKGQVIAQIDQAELQKRLQQDLNAYLRERWDFESSQDATDYHVETLATRRGLDQEQWNLEDTVLNVEIRDIAINNTRLSAPFSGILVDVPLTTTGVNLLATDVFQLINPETLVFKAAVDEADIANVSLGQIGTISLDAYRDEPLTASVSAIGYKSQQSSTGTVFIVELPLEAGAASGSALLNKYRLGMNGDVTLNLDERKNVLAVPLDATRQRDGKTYVDVRTGATTVAEREVVPGLETDDWLEITSGLSTSDEIVLSSNTN